MPGSGKGQDDRECGTLAGLAVGRNIAFVGAGDRTGDIQTQSTAR